MSYGAAVKAERKLAVDEDQMCSYCTGFLHMGDAYVEVTSEVAPDPETGNDEMVSVICETCAKKIGAAVRGR